MHRDDVVERSPFYGSYNTYLALDKVETTDNRFQFEHEALASLAIDDYPLEHWTREHIAISTVPFANIHFIDPICITGYDYSNVFITVKAEELVDIPGEMRIKNYDGMGSISPVHIVSSDPLPGQPPSSDGGSGGDQAVVTALLMGMTTALLISVTLGRIPVVPTLLQVDLLALEGLDPALNSAQLACRAWAPVALFLLRWWPNCQALVLSALCRLGLLLGRSFLQP